MQIPFGNGQAMMINNEDIWSGIQKKFYEEYKFNTDYKYQQISDVNELYRTDEQKYMSSLDFGGIKVFLFLTKMDKMNTCMYMDRQKRKIYIVNYRFNDELFTDTIFSGELVTRLDGRNLFVIEDLIVMSGKNIMSNKTIIQRHGLINEILTNMYHEDTNLETHNFAIKRIYLDDKLEDLSKYMIESKEHIENIKSIIYVPCLSNYMHRNYYLKNIQEEEDKDEDKLYDTDKTFCFKIVDSGKPEIYYLYLNNNSNNIGIARLPNLECSQYINNLVLESKDDVYVNCKFDKDFQKWIPLEHCKDKKEADDFYEVKRSMIEIK